jgi:microcystin-dependent protein
MITRYKAADPLDPTSQAEYKVLAAGAQRYWHGTRAAFEQVKNSIPNNTMICITDDNDAPSDNAPIGSVFAYYGSTSPDGYLICDGSTFDTSLYPDLYLFLGSDTLPDLRECTLVGIGQNTTHTIAAHDEYTLGQFKDDQLQDHSHTFIQEGGTVPSNVALNSIAIFGGNSNSATNNKAMQGVYNARAGTTTHGKQVGVNYIIKATSNMSKSDASALLAQVIQHMTPDWGNAEVIAALPYTATKRGIIVGSVDASSSTGGTGVYSIQINGVTIGRTSVASAGMYDNTDISTPVNANDVLTATGASFPLGIYLTFVPYK